MSKKDINAESIGDLCADNNSISTWFVGEKTEEEVINAVTALASGFRSLDEVKVVFVDDKNLSEAGLSIVKSDGVTKIPSLSHLHRDISDLKAQDLITIADIIFNSVWQGETLDVNTEKLSLWLLQQMNSGKLKFSSLQKNFKQGFAGKIKKLINKHEVKLDELNPDLKMELERQWASDKRKTTCDFELECPRFNKASSI